MPHAHRRRYVLASLIMLVGAAASHEARAQPANDQCASARVIASGQSINTSNESATVEIASSSCSSAADGLDVWFRFTAPSAGDWRFEIPLDFSATLISPILTVYDACGGSELACAGLNAFIRIDQALTAGQTVWLRVAGDDSTTGTFTLTAGPTPAPPPYDECAGAIGLVLNELEAPYVEASASVGPMCPPDRTDLWFSFLAPEAGRYRFTATGGGPPVAMTAYADCTLASVLACDDNCDGIGRVVLDLSAGQQIRLRAAACFDPGVGNPVVFYTLADVAPPTPGNDDCGAATPISAGSMLAGTTRGATGVLPAINCFGDTLNSLDVLDVWYTFTNTGAQTLLFSFTATPSGGDFQPLVRLYNVCDGALLDCGEPFGAGGEATVNRIMTPGESLRIRVAGLNLSEGDFTLAASAGVMPAANDDCGAAASLLPGINLLDSTAAATGNGTGSECGPDDFIDVWYSLTNPAADPRMFILDTVGSTGIESPSIVVFAGCGGPVVACAWATAQVFPASRTAFILDGGETVKVRIAGGLRSVGSFVLNVSEALPVPAAPSNDECPNAQVITGFPFSVDLAAGTSGDESDIPCDGQDGPASGGVWYAIPPLPQACTMVMQVPPLGLPELSLAVYEGTDCQALTLAACEASTLSLIPLQADTPYRLLVTRQSGALAQPDDQFRFSLDCLNTVVAGETCASAVTAAMPVRGLLNNAAAANEGAADAPAGSCNTDAIDGLNNSLYMRWVAPAAGTLRGRFDPVFTEGIAAVYTGGCGSLTEVACAAFAQPLEWSINVAAGQSYLIQYGANGADWPGGDVLVDIDFEPSCIADFNNSGGVSVQDIFDFLAGYFSGDPRADVNSSGAVTVQDIFDFLSAYFGGC